MRVLAPLMIASVALAGCGTMAPPEPRTAKQEIQLRKALAGKVAGKPVDCLPSFSQSNMEVVDDNTILFHDGRNRVFVQSPRGGCSPLGSGGYTLVTTLRGSSSLCRGDISRVVDLSAGMTAGSCSMDSFIPYVKPKA